MKFNMIIWLCFARLTSSSDDLLAMFNTLQQFLNPEEDVVTLLKTLLSNQDFRLDKVKSYLENFKELDKLTSDGSISEFMANPLNAYSLIKRLVVNWKELENVIKQSPEEGAQMARLSSMITGSKGQPSEEELNEVAFTIVRLQDVYNLSLNDIAHGKLGKLQTNIVLTASDCWRLGHQSLLNLDLDLALAWFEQGLLQQKEIKSSNNNELFNSQLDNLRMLKSMLQNSMKLVTPEVIQSLSIIPGLPTELLHHLVNKDDDTNPRNAVHRVYKQLCRGEELILPEARIPLDCMYIPHDVTGNLQRVKVEYLSYQPLVALLHDVVYDKEAEFIKKEAAPKLEPTKVHKYDNPSDIKASFVRTAKAMWLSKTSHSILRQLYKRLEDFTGLETSSAEDLHVVKYEIGGHYEVHTDFFDFHSKGTTSEYGDRIATLLLYLSDVPAGGDTVFPNLMLSVTPKKGSALFWFNLQRNGRGDFRTIHAACPVLTGTKWVANMWILDKGQAFRRPCGLNPNE